MIISKVGINKRIVSIVAESYIDYTVCNPLDSENAVTTLFYMGIRSAEGQKLDCFK